MDNFGLMLRACLIGLGLSIISNYLNNGSHTSDTSTALLFAFCAIAVSILSVLVHIGFIKLGLRLIDGEKPKIKELLSYTNYFWRFIGGGILCGIILGAIAIVGFGLIFALVKIAGINLAVGLILAAIFIIIALIVGIRLCFVLFLIVDENMGPVQAIKGSWQNTRHLTTELFLFFLTSAGINILGAICLGVGLFVTVPLTFISLLLIYRQVVDKSLPAISGTNPVHPEEVPVHVLQ